MSKADLASKPSKILGQRIDPQRLSHDLREAVSDLHNVNSWAGLLRFVSLGLATICLSFLTWQSSQVSWFVLGAIATSILYAFWLICDHDATHRTLTGWNWFDAIMPRIVSWALLLPIGTYNQLHHLHHGYNGSNLQDPERVQWTDQEYQSAPSWQRCYVRHQWIIDIFVLGSIGLVFKTLTHSLQLQNDSRSISQQIRQQIRQQTIVDACGIFGTQAVIISFLQVQSLSLWKYFLFLFVLERGTGIILQMRAHIEHYGLWQVTGNHQLTQLYACRNISTFAWIGWLMGGLPYHSIHHAFPQIASYRLPGAFQRVQAVLKHHALPPMAVGSGYIATTIELSRQPCFIREESSRKTVRAQGLSGQGLSEGMMSIQVDS